jgi:pyridoxine 4-dehydrogenase
MVRSAWGRKISRRSEQEMPTQTVSASAAGTISLGGELTVHRLGYGAMRITGPGIWGPPNDHAGALAVLRKAAELGVNFIDTADSYGPNVSEELIAEALAPYPNALVVATKGGWIRPGPGYWSHDASPEHLRQAVEGSLQRLRLERIDLYQLHVPAPITPFDQSVGALAELRKQGKIRLIGLSNVTREHVERALKIVPIASVQNRYSFADREWENVLEYCEQQRIAFIPWFPLGGGKAAGEVLLKLAKKHNAKPTQVALAWLLGRSPVMLPIPGTTSVEHLEENLGAAAVKLSQEEMAELGSVRD